MSLLWDNNSGCDASLENITEKRRGGESEGGGRKNNLLSLHPAPPPLDQQDGTKFSCLTEGENYFCKSSSLVFFPRRKKIAAEKEWEKRVRVSSKSAFLKKEESCCSWRQKTPAAERKIKKSVLIEGGKRSVCSGASFSPPPTPMVAVVAAAIEAKKGEWFPLSGGGEREAPRKKQVGCWTNLSLTKNP